MARILGLDLGSHSVKAVLLEATLRARQTLAYAEVRRPPGDKRESLEAALRQLRQDHDLQADLRVVSLPGPSLTTHHIALPFTDPRRIEAALGFEVESQLPYDLSEAAYDHQTVAQTGQGTELLVGVVRRPELLELLELLGRLELDPRVVTHPALVYHALLEASLEGQGPVGFDEPLAIVDLGHERTCVAIGRPGRGVELARTFPSGGKDLTRALANEFKISVEEAAAWKEAHGAVGQGAQGPDGERAAAAFTRALQGTERELRSTFKSYTARTRLQVSRVHLCGGTARLAGIDALLASDLGLPVEPLHLPKDASGVVASEVEPRAAQAYALALRGQVTSRTGRFNLRRGELGFKGDYDYVREKLGVLASFGVALLVLLLAMGVVRNTLLSRREQQVDAALCDITQRVLGRCERSYDRALNMMQGQESPAAALPQRSAVDLLAELLERVPKDMKVTFDQILIDLDRVSVQGETDSSSQVDGLTESLKGYRCFQDVRQGKLERSRTGEQIRFRLDIQVECPNEAAPTRG